MRDWDARPELLRGCPSSQLRDAALRVDDVAARPLSRGSRRVGGGITSTSLVTSNGIGRSELDEPVVSDRAGADPGELDRVAGDVVDVDRVGGQIAG